MITKEEIQKKSSEISNYLEEIGIAVDRVDVVTGPRVSLYKVVVKPGFNPSKIKYLQDELAWNLGLKRSRVITMADCIGIEVANDEAEIVYLRSAMDWGKKQMEDMELPFVLGYSTETQRYELFDLKKAPHLLVSGITKQGKTEFLFSAIQSLLEVKINSVELYICDPKQVLGALYPNAKIVCQTLQDTENVMKDLCAEMERRLETAQKKPSIVVVIDELADLTVPFGSKERKLLSKSIYTSIIRLAQQGQTGIHLIAATQRPTPEVLTGLLKSNFPTRIAFRTASKTESKLILDFPGAEALVGNGDMLFSCGGRIQRIQACICDENQ